MDQAKKVDVTEQLWADYRQQLYLFILKRVNDPVVAEDLVQDVLTKVFTHRDSLRDDDKLRSWLYQITRNVVVDYYRSRRPEAELPDGLFADETEMESPTSQEFADCCIRPFVEQLPPPYREAVLLSELEGLTQAEVAAQQGISLSGAKSRVQRGRKLLKGALLQCCQLEFGQQGELTDYEPQQQSCSGC